MQIEPECFTIEDYLHHTFSCECGRSHHTDVEKILISQGALERVPEAVEELGYQKYVMVSQFFHCLQRYVQVFKLSDEDGIHDYRIGPFHGWLCIGWRGFNCK